MIAWDSEDDTYSGLRGAMAEVESLYLLALEDLEDEVREFRKRVPISGGIIKALDKLDALKGADDGNASEG